MTDAEEAPPRDAGMPPIPTQAVNPTTSATGSTQPNQMTASVHFHAAQTPKSSGKEEADDNGKSSESRMERMLMQMQAMQSELSTAMQQLQARVDTAEQHRQSGREGLATHRLGYGADSLPTPIPSNRYPSTAARNGTFNRPSFGVPSNPFASSPSTPVRAAYRDHSDAAAAAEDIKAQAASEEAEMRVTKDVLATVKALVDPFYADSSKDKGATVMDFVEKVETTMNDVLRWRPQYRLMVVRTFLKEGAMRWMNAKLKELTDRAYATGRDLDEQPIEWDSDVRRLFIAAHIGTDTVELWLSKLSMLELGSAQTKTPIELDSQFDTIARHVYPTESTNDVGVDLLLAGYYATIVFKYSEPMYNTIVRNRKPVRLAEWKTRLSEQFTAEEHIKAMRRMAGHAQSSRGKDRWNKGQGQVRGGQAAPNNKPQTAQAAVAAMDLGDTRKEGQTSTGDGEDEEDAQLNAVSGGGQSDGRGKKGTRGRGRRNSHLSQEQVEQLRARRPSVCLSCYKPGHFSSECTTPANRAPTQAELNA